MMLENEFKQFSLKLAVFDILLTLPGELCETGAAKHYVFYDGTLSIYSCFKSSAQCEYKVV